MATFVVVDEASGLHAGAVPVGDQAAERDADIAEAGSGAAATEGEDVEPHRPDEAPEEQEERNKQTEQKLPKRRIAKCTAWLKNTKTGNIVAICGFVVTVVGLAWAILSQRYSVRAGTVSQCMSFYGKLQVPGCNETLAKVQVAGVPGFFTWKRDALRKSPGALDADVRPWDGSAHLALAIVVTVAALLVGLVHIRPGMQPFRPVDSLVRIAPDTGSCSSDTAENVDFGPSKDNPVQGTDEPSDDNIPPYDLEESPLEGLNIPADYQRFAQTPWANKIILSLDGGGVRCYGTLLILKAIMDRITAIEGDVDKPSQTAAQNPMQEYRPHHYFDYMVGTGTGALIAIMLGRLQRTIADADDLLLRLGNSVFKNPRLLTANGVLRPRYSSERLERVLKDAFGDLLLHSGREYACRTAVTTFVGSDHQVLHLLQSYHPVQPPPLHNLPIWKVAMAATALPTYFSPQSIGGMSFEDGSLGGGTNPAKIACQEAWRMHSHHDLKLVLSIGAGHARSDSDQSPKSSNITVIRQAHQHLQQVQGMMKSILDPNIVHNKMLQYAAENSKKLRYYRFDYESPIRLDEWKGKNGIETSVQLEGILREYLQSAIVRQEIDECAHILLDVRRKRARTDRWRDRASDRVYHCPLKTHEGCKITEFSDRGALRQHLLSAHAMARQIPCENFSGQIVAPWSCYLPNCEENRHWGRRFDSKGQLEKHLEFDHEIRDVKFMSPVTFEDLVDGIMDP